MIAASQPPVRTGFLSSGPVFCMGLRQGSFIAFTFSKEKTMPDLFDLTGRVALVTGASSGLGVQFAAALARQGARLAIAARREDRLNAVAEDLRAMGAECLPVRCDIRDEAAVRAMVDAVVGRYGRIDILVNNAGIAPGGSAQDTSTEEWNRAIDTDLSGVFVIAREVGRHMLRQGYGKIINTASMMARVGMIGSGTAAYCAAKAGVAGLTRDLAVEWARSGVTVNAIGPGFFPTDIDREHIATPEFQSLVQVRCPMGRIGRDGELDGALIYFASDASSYTTGQILFVDGGWTSA